MVKDKVSLVLNFQYFFRTAHFHIISKYRKKFVVKNSGKTKYYIYTSRPFIKDLDPSLFLYHFSNGGKIEGMPHIISYIPPAVLRKNATGSYKIRLSLDINPKLCQRRIQLGLGTKDCSEAEEIAIAACLLFMKTGLFSRKCLRIIHETEKEEFFLLKKGIEYPQTISISKNSIEKYNLPLPQKSEIIPLYKEKSFDQSIFTINTKKEKMKKAMDLATKIIHITSKAYSYSIPPIHVFCLQKQTVTDKKRK